MTFQQFLLDLKKLAQEQAAPVLAIEFDVDKDGQVSLMFRFKPL